MGLLLLLELLLRFRFLHPFYADEGTLPTRLLLTKIDSLYRAICIHAYSGSMIYQQVLLSIQSILALFLLVGYKTHMASVLSWFLYLSLTLRNTWLNFILDRYFHYMLFYSMFLPISSCWSVDSFIRKRNVDAKAERNYNDTIVTLATIAIKAQVFWIYLDAGQGKYNDPLGGWTLNANPLPALDTYARHTVRMNHDHVTISFFYPPAYFSSCLIFLSVSGTIPLCSPNSCWSTANDTNSCVCRAAFSSFSIIKQLLRKTETYAHCYWNNLFATCRDCIDCKKYR